ncbi:hypothetical protein [Bradyrhizobium sp. CCBAU 45321]|uniref:hypothetical protein n=1 Tax=Bradyrhizobium sp. CCBAU 45321 TaxID=1641878 RepID=UPI002303AFDC|nr:hypothetical protein [Bradyrhizobium sp. CCBAU 45321]
MVRSTLQKPTSPSSNTPAAAPRSIAVHPLTGHVGADIGGVNLKEPLHPLVLEELKAALCIQFSAASSLVAKVAGIDAEVVYLFRWTAGTRLATRNTCSVAILVLRHTRRVFDITS